MPGHERHLGGGEFLGHGAGLFRIAGVIAELEHELAAEHAARRIEVGDRELGAVLHLRAERGFRPAQGTGEADGNVLRRSRPGKAEARAERKNGQ